MSDARMLFLVRLVHTVVYLVNAGACFVMLYAGLTGVIGVPFWISAVLVGIEAIVFFGNGARCPLSGVALRYGASRSDFLFDTFMPERLTRHTVFFFSIVVLFGLALLALRGLGLFV